MSRAQIVALVLLSIFAAAASWLFFVAPWATEEWVTARAKSHLARAQADFAERCNFDCPDCGVHKIEPVGSGHMVTLWYACSSNSKEASDATPAYAALLHVSDFGFVHIFEQGPNPAANASD